MEQLQQQQQQQHNNKQIYIDIQQTEQQQQTITATEATIINIPTTTTEEKEVIKPSCILSTDTTQQQQQQQTAAYDTDSSSISSSSTVSSVSSTCCTRHDEQIYMERGGMVNIIATKKTQLPTTTATTSTTTTTSTSTTDTDADDDMDAIRYKTDHRKSWPIFILLISLIEIAIFVYDFMQLQPKSTTTTTTTVPINIPTDSVLIYRPDRRLEIWRFVSYMFLHANLFHLGFNVVVQLFYGIPLEVMHGSSRIAIIYFAGVFAGSLGTSVVDSEVYLVGASGGVYALLAAHLANITLNYSQMKYAVAQLLSVIIFVTCDLGYAFYTQFLYVDMDEQHLQLAADKQHRYHHHGHTHVHQHYTTHADKLAAHLNRINNNNLHNISDKNDLLDLRSAPPVSYIAHLTGALAGLTIGLLVLKNFERRAYKNLIWWLALGIYSAFTVFAIAFNLINTMTAQLMEEQGEVITQHLV